MKTGKNCLIFNCVINFVVCGCVCAPNGMPYTMTMVTLQHIFVRAKPAIRARGENVE